MPKSERWSLAKPALIYLTPLENCYPLFSHIRHATREENPCLFPILPSSSPPRSECCAPGHISAPHAPSRGAARQIIAVSAVPPARTRPRGSPLLPPPPPLGTSRGAPPAPLPPSLGHLSPADSSGVPGQRRERLAGEMETETHHGLRQREEEREGFPMPGSPELGNSDSCGAKGELLGFGVSPALRALRSCRCPVGGEGKAEGGWRDAGVFHVENAPFDFIIHFGE